MWIDDGRFRHDRKARKAALLAAFASDRTKPGAMLALYALWCYLRKNQCNMHGILKWRNASQDGHLVPGLTSDITHWYNSTVRVDLYDKANKSMDRAAALGKINRAATSTLGKQIIPKGLGVSLAAGTIGVSKTVLDPFFRHGPVQQLLQEAFRIANAVDAKNPNSTPSKKYLIVQLERDRASTIWYNRFVSFCGRNGWNASEVGFTSKAEAEADNTPLPTSTVPTPTKGWNPGVKPR